MLLSELNLLPLKVFWWRQCLRFWNKLVAAPLDSFHRTVLLDNLQDAVRFRVRNFSSSVAVALQSVGHSMPSGWAVLPTLDVDAVVSSLELSLKLPDPVCLDPRVAPSQGVVQCTYVNWFLPSQAKFRSCYFPAAAHRVQKFLAFKLGCHGLPVAMGRRSGIPRSARLCPHCHDGNLGDELHMVFECSFLQPLRVQYANLFSDNIQTMRQFFSQEDFGGILSFVLSCLTLLDV